MKNSAIKRLIIYSLFIIVIGAGGLTLGASNTYAQSPRVQVFRNIDEPALNPYQQTNDTSCSPGAGCEIDFPPVPSGKRLVIQSVSVGIRCGSNPSSTRAWLWESGSGSRVIHSLPVISQGDNNFSVNQTVQHYYEAGKSPEILLRLEAENRSPVAIIQQSTISGYTVHLP
jgi:hypothetical protein